MGQCSICSSRDRAEIEASIAVLGIRGAAKKHALDKSLLSRHAKHREEEQREQDGSLKSMLRSAQRARASAERAHDVRGVLSALELEQDLRRQIRAMERVATGAKPEEPTIRVIYDSPPDKPHNIIAMLRKLVENRKQDDLLSVACVRLIGLLRNEPLPTELESECQAIERRTEEKSNEPI